MPFHRIPGAHLVDHWLDVPLDRSEPAGEQIEIYAREVVDPARVDDDLPWLLFLQGGPGGKAPRPTSTAGWLGVALREFRVLLLDQRGTGRSTPVTARSLTARGDAAAQAAYLQRFRADHIVADAEALRMEIAGGRPWSTLGQSYGGFVTLTYLSQAFQGLRECFITGGLAGLDADAAEIYRRLYPRVRQRSLDFYHRFPHDAEVMRAIAHRLSGPPVLLPTGEPLTIERVQSLGMAFGGSSGAATVHYLLEEAMDGPELSTTFLAGVADRTSFATNPLYAVLQESIYAQGPATGWAAQALRPDDFDAAADGPVLFTGEMVFPWTFTQDPSLWPFAAAADVLAASADWPPLYDPERLRTNTVPVVAAIYHDDMYVDADLSLDTASRVGALRRWITDEYEHDGLRADGARVLGRLLDMARGRA